MPRLFFALWPDGPTRNAIDAQRAAIAHDYAGRATRPDTLHLTLLFLGNMPDLEVPTLLACGDRIRAGSFTITLDARCHFEAAKVAWLGATDPPPALDALYRALRDEVMAAGFGGVDDGFASPFAPHVTIARHCTLFPQPRAVAPITWLAQDFVLIDSRSTPGGPVYRVLRHWPLQS